MSHRLRHILNDLWRRSVSNVWFPMIVWWSSGRRGNSFISRIVVPLPRSSLDGVTEWWLGWHLIVIMYIVGSMIIVGSYMKRMVFARKRLCEDRRRGLWRSRFGIRWLRVRPNLLVITLRNRRWVCVAVIDVHGNHVVTIKVVVIVVCV